MPVDLARVLRLKATVIAAAQLKPDDAAATALTESYNRPYQIARQLVDEADDLPIDEFDQLFDALDEVEMPQGLQGFALKSASLEAEAKRASSRLLQLGGWLDGIVEAATLELAIAAKAKEAAQLEASTRFMRE